MEKLAYVEYVLVFLDPLPKMDVFEELLEGCLPPAAHRSGADGAEVTEHRPSRGRVEAEGPGPDEDQ